MAQLDSAKTRQRQLRKEIKALHEFIRNVGSDPAPKVDLTIRNREIYKSWKDGKTFKAISLEYKLTLDRISSVCRRIDVILQKQSADFDWKCY